MLAGDRLHSVESLLDLVASCRVHIDRLAVAAQSVYGLADLDARALQQFNDRSERVIELRELLDRALRIGNEAVGIAVVAVEQAVGRGDDPFREAAAVLQSPAFGAEFFELAADDVQ